MYKQRDIVLVPFPYSDLSSSKKRPVLILSNDDYNQTYDDVVVSAITSSFKNDRYALALTNDDLEIGLLPEQSAVKAHKIFTIAQSQILRKFGVVKRTYFQTVVEKITTLVSAEPSPIGEN